MGRTLLDIGGGVGAVQHELPHSGVASAQEVEASAAYLAACRAEAKRQGHADRITHLFGDLASVAGDVQPADIVMRVMAHRRADVESILASHGLQRYSYAEVGMWQIAVYAKDSD